MQKIKDIDALFSEILMTNEFWNLIGRQHLTYNLWTRIFPGMGCVQENKTEMSFVFGYFQQKVMKSQRTPFWVFSVEFGQIRTFPENLLLSLFSVFRFFLPCRILEITNEYIPRKVGYTRTAGGTHRRTDARISMNSLNLPCQGSKRAFGPLTKTDRHVFVCARIKLPFFQIHWGNLK